VWTGGLFPTELFPSDLLTGAPGLWGTIGLGAARDPRKFLCDSMLRFLGSSFMRRIFNLAMVEFGKKRVVRLFLRFGGNGVGSRLVSTFARS
jgi:hypothetical protein